MKSFLELTKQLTEGPFQPNGTDKVDYEKGMDGNAQSPDKKTKKSKNYGDIKILNGEQEAPIKEAVYVEESRTESGELFKSLVDRAHDASERGDHTQAKRHLANAQTARYGITSGNIAKHKKSFDKYKELKHSYTNSDEHVREETVDEHIVKVGSQYELKSKIKKKRN